MLKNLSALQETGVQSLGRKTLATHSSILAWEIPWTEEPGGLPSTEWQQSSTRLNASTAITTRCKRSCPSRGKPGNL